MYLHSLLSETLSGDPHVSPDDDETHQPSDNSDDDANRLE